MSRSILVVILLTALIVSGCSLFRAEPLKTDLPVMEKDWTISMTHAGGIMGLLRKIEISSDGKYTVTDERKDVSVTKELGSVELSKLKSVVDSSNYITLESPRPTVCADCFVYAITILGGGTKFNVQLDDISLQDSGMEDLVKYLRSLMDAALK
jgi:hypothetical protein